MIAYRVRRPDRRGAEVVIARSADGERLAAIAALEKERFGAESLERPALVRTEDGRWRLYVSCATPGSKHWRIDLLEARRPEELSSAPSITVFSGDRHTGVKDPVIRYSDGAWRAWICCHPLDITGEEDRMTTAYATSADGVTWEWRGTALTGRAGSWDARGARVTAVLADGRAAYDGRATKEENFSERTGLATPGDRRGDLVATSDEPASTARYLDVLELPNGEYRIWYEFPLPDGSHELRTEAVAT
ncbi:MAG TPA: hypothetical protein VFR33_12360 [Candidatus Dormibacteraeota bacterium]|nr:hypothetical protein [Candidatus Dormibacteraeota bacterium]